MMMRPLLTGIVVFAVLLSCNNGKIKRPDNLIPQNKMVDIIVDLTLLNSAQGLNKKVLDKEDILPDLYVYKKYNIDSIQFLKSNAYYAHDIDVYHEIYVKVKARISKDKEKYKKIADIEAKEKKKQDSLRRAKNRINKEQTLKVKKKEVNEY